ncbi:tripartite tricarboxylate transporter TctB family protein [Cetobacterium somerae]|uniref:tripartite tricarboxylate transporter TctB family protein n=1 Tax=Cetobacterium TaxID=180162 RepID=UPI00224F4FF6|nr:tripartite tricarboxylate transporter TctB family protein [Cetobacterium somerae]MCX3065985.1 tripartite tricarboxylate transporter TctB family protein [Cetobacterium somerae]
MKLKTNLIGGSLFLSISVIIWFLIPSQIILTQNTSINSQTFPRLIVSLSIISSILLILKESIKIIKKEPTEEIEFIFNNEVKVIVMLILLVVYVFLFEYLGFLFSSIIYSFLTLMYYKSKNIKYYISIALVCLIVNYIFKNLLLVQLP